MNIFITGGCGYIGTLLTHKLLEEGHNLTIIDKMWFGNYLKNQKNLKIINDDFRNVNNYSLNSIDILIHLANIANDPSVEVDPNISWDTNVLGSQILIEKAIKSGVKKFIYASSGSVYGIKNEEDVTEDLDLVPISIYNKTKMIAERVLLSHQKNIDVYCIRPATVCGYSPRMRLDISVNMLTFQALDRGKITVLGGNQTRPNINIHDMVRVYEHFINNPNLPIGCYNAGFENIAIIDLAEKIKKISDASIEVRESNDPRSYRQNSDKLLSTGFKRKFSIDDAINEIMHKYQNKMILDEKKYYNVKVMKEVL